MPVPPLADMCALNANDAAMHKVRMGTCLEAIIVVPCAWPEAAAVVAAAAAVIGICGFAWALLGLGACFG